MQMTECESSHIRAYGYDHATETMAIKFNDGTVYHWEKVIPELWEFFQAAESKGEYLHKTIRMLCGNGVKQESAEVF